MQESARRQLIASMSSQTFPISGKSHYHVYYTHQAAREWSMREKRPRKYFPASGNRTPVAGMGGRAPTTRPLHDPTNSGRKQQAILGHYPPADIRDKIKLLVGLSGHQRTPENAGQSIPERGRPRRTCPRDVPGPGTEAGPRWWEGCTLTFVVPV